LRLNVTTNSSKTGDFGMDQKQSGSTGYYGIWATSVAPRTPLEWLRRFHRSQVSNKWRFGRDAPIRDVPFTMTDPFGFSQIREGALERAYLWNKLLFDSRLLPTNRFFFFYPDPDRMPPSNLFDPAPMNPREGAPILPQQFR